MILEAVVVIILNALSALIGALPWGDAFSFNLSPAFGAMLTLDAFLPLHEAVTAVGLYVGVVGGVFAFGLLRQVWRFVPFVGGG